MSPKTPRKPPVTTPNKPGSTNEPSIRPESDTSIFVPHRIWPADAIVPLTSDMGLAARPDVDLPVHPPIEVTDLPTRAVTRLQSDTSLSKYWLSANFLRGMQPPDKRRLSLYRRTQVCRCRRWRRCAYRSCRLRRTARRLSNEVTDGATSERPGGV